MQQLKVSFIVVSYMFDLMCLIYIVEEGEGGEGEEEEHA